MSKGCVGELYKRSWELTKFLMLHVFGRVGPAQGSVSPLWHIIENSKQESS